MVLGRGCGPESIYFRRLGLRRCGRRRTRAASTCPLVVEALQMSSLDQLRGYYVRSPRWVQATGGRILSAVPPRVLYGRSFRELQVDIKRSEWDARFVELRRGELLQRLLAHARRTKYYAELLKDIDVDAPSVADLSRLPILDKEQVRRSVDDMLARPQAEMDEVTTGGTSSGVPLSLYMDKERSVKEWAFLTRLWQRCGYRIGDRLAVLGYRGVTHLSSPASKPWAWEPGTREVRLSPFRMVPPVMDEYLTVLERFKVAFIYGYPSAIAILAAHARNVGWSPAPTLRGVLLMSESLRPFQRQAIAEGFGPVSVLAGYGLSEKVAIAGEILSRADEYEFEPLYGVAELVDGTDHPISVPGQQGRLVGTGFVSMGMPLIRYDTGDLATFVEAPSAENCQRLRVRDIVSRYAQDYLITRESGVITPIVLYANNRVAREVQFVQHEPGLVILRIVPEQGVEPRDLDALLNKMNERADGLLSVTLEIVDEIPLTPRGKRVLVDQHLDLSAFGAVPEP